MDVYTLQDLLLVSLAVTLGVLNGLTLVLSKQFAFPTLSLFDKKKQFNWTLVVFSIVQLFVFVGQSKSALDHLVVSFLFLFWPSFYFCFLDSNRLIIWKQRHYVAFYAAYVLGLLTLITYFVHDFFEKGSAFFFHGLVVLLLGVILYFFIRFFIVSLQVKNRKVQLLLIGFLLSHLGMLSSILGLGEIGGTSFSFVLFSVLLVYLSFLHLFATVESFKPESREEQRNPFVSPKAVDPLTSQVETAGGKYLKSSVDTLRTTTLKERVLALPPTYYFDSTLNLEKMALTLNASKYEVSFLFSNQFEKNFNQYVNAIRVRQAKELLTSKQYSHVSVKEVGLEVGFSSNTSFYRAFKEVYAIPPQEYRAKQQDKKD